MKPEKKSINTESNFFSIFPSIHFSLQGTQEKYKMQYRLIPLIAAVLCLMVASVSAKATPCTLEEGCGPLFECQKETLTCCAKTGVNPEMNACCSDKPMTVDKDGVRRCG